MIVNQDIYLIVEKMDTFKTDLWKENESIFLDYFKSIDEHLQYTINTHETESI